MNCVEQIIEEEEEDEVIFGYVRRKIQDETLNSELFELEVNSNVFRVCSLEPEVIHLNLVGLNGLEVGLLQLVLSFDTYDVRSPGLK
ncbi:8542_t:CDS:2 [Scutellospora calospora]|uniref:8542_t:CDS:1 n=1 Tax=Scutellospora calospora TaxID=85575 RepID=A0ACA9KCQ4_9GLOM|nr:8542_t:CDS:2 [Scutellospora calospora]